MKYLTILTDRYIEINKQDLLRKKFIKFCVKNKLKCSNALEMSTDLNSASSSLKPKKKLLPVLDSPACE